jgi:hypothetical protein
MPALRGSSWRFSGGGRSMALMSDSSDDEDVKEVMTEDGRQVLYSVNSDDEKVTDTDEWIASDTTVSGSDQQ